MPQYKKVFDAGLYSSGGGFTRVGVPTLRTPGSGGKQVAKSLRFRAANSAYLSRTSGTSTDQTKATLSFWMKSAPSISSVVQPAIWGNTSNNGIVAWNTTSYGGKFFVRTDATNDILYPVLFKDASVWQHIVVAVDTTQATGSNRVKLYVNSILQTASSGTAIQNSTNFNSSSTVFNIGRDIANNYYWDGYLSEYYFIDGQTLDATSFGEYNSDNIWVPKAYSGSFSGTNSFYLDFSDVGTTTAGGANTGYGKDLSGKGTPNNWTTNNFGTTSTTASYDSMYDSPTDYDNSVYGAGNYATLNPLINGSLSTISEANLKASNTTGYDVVATLWATTKCYYEYIITNTAAATTPVVGMGDPSVYLPVTNNLQNVNGAFGIRKDGAVYVNGSSVGTFASFTTGDIVGIALDPATGKFWYHVNGVWANSGNPTAGTGNIGTVTVGLKYFPALNLGLSSAICTLNFGQQPFRGVYVSGSGSSYTGTGAPPSGFLALNTKNITRPTDANMWFYGDTPDLVWIKNRSATANHSLTDTVRGVGLSLFSNSTSVQLGDQDIAELNKFGMTLIGASSRTTASANNFVYWAWKGGGAASTNTSGSITSQVSANVSAGFSIVTYTGNGTSGATVGHGLGVVPSMVIIKGRDNTNSWMVKTSSLASTANLRLQDTAASTAALGSGYIGDLSSSSTVTLTSGASGIQNVNENTKGYVAYCFAPVSGYSAMGSYTGNGASGASGTADGPFIFTGFRPRWIMGKRTDTTGDWWIIDTSRDLYNVSQNGLNPNLSNAESTGWYIDALSNGFKIRVAGTGASVNALNGTYIYAAFAEYPFKIARAR